MNNVIMIDLTKVNKEKLKEIAELYDMDYDSLKYHKKDGFTKLWFDITTGLIIAYSLKQWKDNIFMTEDFMSDLANMKCIKIPKNIKELDVDTLLDKVSKYGINSLSGREKDFLNNQ